MKNSNRLPQSFPGNCEKLGIKEHAVLAVQEIEFSSEVRKLCADNYCGGYGRTWACPPGVGTVEECRTKCEKYSSVYVFSTVHELEDSFDYEGMMEGKAAHEKICGEIEKLFAAEFGDTLMLTAEGCGNCEKCTYPDAPCRFPDRMHPSVESYGISVVKEAATAGIQYINGENTVTYFGNIFF